MKIFGFCKLRNEALHEGNIHRVLNELDRLCDGGIICDDASTDGTADILRDWVTKREGWALLEVGPEDQSFANEMAVKQVMMEALHSRADKPDWILWLDGDESIDYGARAFRQWIDGDDGAHQAIKCKYTQVWRTQEWARTDQGFDDGVFVKLWRYSPSLSFDTAPGTHRAQFPQQIDYGAAPVAPFECIHWGNFGKNLVWKAIQYAGGLGGVDRHIAFGHPASESQATGVGFDQSEWSAPVPQFRRLMHLAASPQPSPPPEPFTPTEIRRIRSLGDLRGLRDHFCVIAPAYNRAATLPRALDSLLAQTYDKWIAIVLDDGSQDNTRNVMREYQDRDPRIFYARYETNRGGVAMNEIGMSLACEMTEWWSRLGSDDWWGPRKLELDAAALREHEAVYGAFRVWRDDRGYGETCNPPMRPDDIHHALRAGRFLVSWANCAARTSTLVRVRERFGAFADARLRNCEDFIVNARIAEVADWVWRGPEERPFLPVGQAWNWEAPTELEAAWRAAPEGGASSPENAAILQRDEELTRRLIAEMVK